MMSSWQCGLFYLLLLVYVCHTAKKKKQTYYDILEIPQNSTQREIRKAYFALIKIYHPDKNELYDEKKKVREQFELISNAYEILSDEEKRTQYDRLLELGHTEYKESNVPKEREDVRFEFKDPYKAYEEALKKEEEEAWREKAFTITLVVFIVGTLIFTGWISFILIKRTRFYQKIEKQKQELENRKNIAEVKKKRTVKTEKEKQQQQKQALRQQELRQRKLANRANFDLNKVTKWAEDEEDSESSELSTSGEEELSEDNNKGAIADSKPRKASLETEKSKTDIYCMACHKLFKSIKQWENHELSKKHKTEVEKLKGQEKEAYFDKLKDIKKFINLEKTKQEEEKRKKLITDQQQGESGEEEEEDVEKPEKSGSEEVESVKNPDT